MRAERDRRAAILTAEGVKQSQILTAEGEQQSQVLRAQGERDAEVLRAEGQARAIETVFRAIHEGRPDSELLAYQYLQALPKIAEGSSNKMWIVPSDFAQTLGSVAPMLGAITQAAQEGGPSKSAPPRGDDEGGTPALPPGNAPY